MLLISGSLVGFWLDATFLGHYPILRRYMAAEGYELSEKSKFFHSLDSFVYIYTNSAGVRDNIKIEINYSIRCHVLPFVSRPIETLGIFNHTSILSVAPIEIFASKIVALLTRSAARDLYDMSNMVTFGLFSESEAEILRKCTLFYFTIASDEVPEQSNIKRIYSLTAHKIRTDLQPVLRKRERFDLLAAQKRVEGYLTELLTLTANEQQYLDNFRDGEYKPELLFADTDILERIRNHPMVTWKLRPTE